MKNLSKDEFFKILAVNSGITDLDTIKDVFYGLIKTCSKELKNKHKIKLPDWGEFYLQIHKARKIVEVESKKIIEIPAKPTVKFKPDYKLKHYFYELGKDSTML